MLEVCMHLTTMLNHRAELRGLTPDAAVSHQTHYIDMCGIENDSVGSFRVDTWLLYHRNPTINFKPSDAFIRHSDIRLYCDIEGISNNLFALKHKEPILCRSHLIAAIKENVSDRIETIIMHEGMLSEEYIYKHGVFDNFLSSASQHPSLLIRVTAQKRKRRRIVIYPFNSDAVKPNVRETIQALVDDVCRKPLSRDINEFVTDFVQVLYDEFHLPESLSVHLLAGSLCMSLFTNDMPLHMEYGIVLMDDNSCVINLPNKTANIEYIPNITVKTVHDANSS